VAISAVSKVSVTALTPAPISADGKLETVAGLVDEPAIAEWL